jgi:hypothetical protein
LRHEPASKRITDPTSGERLLYALGQHYLRWRREPMRYVPSHRLDVLAVARTRWVSAQVEYVQDGEHEETGVLFLHLPSEVLVIDYRRAFPWRLLGLDEWGERQEWREQLRREA